MIRTRDDWERLVGAVLKKQQLWELFHAHSRSSSEASFSSSSSFREIDTSPAYWQKLEGSLARLGNRVQKLFLVSDFVPAFDVEDVNLNFLRLLGTGTFGNSYACDVSNGVEIMVRRINRSVSVSEEQFKRSMDVVASVRHENVVALRAYYCSQDEKLMLYDYYSQGSVYQLLHGQTSEIAPQVSWETRLRIAIGTARGLASIHALQGGKLVHGNIKSTNIFVNHENYGSISDFGMINLIAAKFRQNERCHAPEVKNTRNVSQESDVYSFGILLFELLTRKPSVGPNPVDLVKLVKSVKSTNVTSEISDAYLLEDSTIREQMVSVLQIGISCVEKSVKRRPKMFEVAKMLEDLYVVQTHDDWERLVMVCKGLSEAHLRMFILGDFSVHSGMYLSWGHYVLRDKPRLVFINQNASARNRFSLEDLLRASNVNFVKGTFGSSSEDFYKVTLKNGIIVRVKIMDDVNVTSGKFKHHMEILGRIKHKNCAKPKAYYFSDDVVLLVHDDFNHENLSDLLNGKFDTRKPLSLKARLKIALTSAKGIVHIHRLFVHGNIRSSSILINRKNAAIITDTALWKVTKQIGSSVLSHQGYLAPEVKHMWNLSQASDVYSFGIVLLELLTRRSSQVTSLVSFVRKLTYKALDPELRGCDAAKKVLTLAMNCVEDAPEQRPKMDVVVKRLDEISWIYEEDQSKPSMYSDFEDVRPGIGSRLEDGLEVITMMPQWQL